MVVHDECTNDQAGVKQLDGKLQKLRANALPVGNRQRAVKEFRRGVYPFRASTLMKLREIVEDLMDQVILSLEVLQLDVAVSSRSLLCHVDSQVGDIVNRTAKIDMTTTSVAKQAAATAKDVQSVLNAQQKAQLDRLLSWLSAPDPYVNHNAALRRHQPGTGSWFVQSADYQKWKTRQAHSLWLHGKAGCCKTILCSTIIEDMRFSFEGDSDIGLAFYYFSFTDSRKQDYRGLLLSLIAQLCHQKPAIAAVYSAHDRHSHHQPSVSVLEDTLMSIFLAFGTCFVVIDALDECPKEHSNRSDILDGLARLASRSDVLNLLVASRKEPDIENHDLVKAAVAVPVDDRRVDEDIAVYVTSELSTHAILSLLPERYKRKIEETFQAKAGGM